jgi:hypothetical protein
MARAELDRPYVSPFFADVGFMERVRHSYEKVFVTYWPYWAATLAAALLNVFEFALYPLILGTPERRAGRPAAAIDSAHESHV